MTKSRRVLSLFNTLTRRVEPVLPVKEGYISFYTCGPTVYNYAHIGNLRTFLFQDLLKRTFRAAAYTVTHCMNITDVEDKIIRDSQGGLPADATNEARHEAMRALTERFTAIFLEDLETLRIQKADHLPKATEYIPGMIRLVQELETKHLAYERDGSVYYRISGLPEYGCLAHLDREGMQSGASVDADEYERDSVTDFVLWKAAKPGEPWWDSPWGPGRPGWHIECSAMGMELLGDRVDIHSGGVDLIFPHHENEIAQAEALTGKTFAKIWVHHGLLTIHDQKMAKSLGNFITVQDALREHSVDALKLFFLSTHYASSIDYTQEKLRDMDKGVAKFRQLFARLAAVAQPKLSVTMNEVEFVLDAKEKIQAALDADLNTALALGHIFDLVTATNRFLDAGRQDDYFEGSAHLAGKFLRDILENIFGMALKVDAAAIASEDEQMLAERVAARQAKEWKRSDELRDLLKARGIIVEDGKTGQTWRRG